MAFAAEDPKWTAYVLGELSPHERAEVERELAESPEAQREVADIRRAVERLAIALKTDASPGLTPEQRKAVCASGTTRPLAMERSPQASSWRARGLAYSAAALAATLLLAAFLLPTFQAAREAARPSHDLIASRQTTTETSVKSDHEAQKLGQEAAEAPLDSRVARRGEPKVESQTPYLNSLPLSGVPAKSPGTATDEKARRLPALSQLESSQSSRSSSRDAVARYAGPQNAFGFRGAVRGRGWGYGITDFESDRDGYGPTGFNTEGYDHIVEARFLSVRDNPLSTFSIDVDTASYSNVRRYLTVNHQLPPKGAVRIEELINYFHYNYPQPQGDAPFSAQVEVAGCPWKPEHRLVRVGLQGKNMEPGQRPASNLVFLIDVSGSMNQPNKLPLVKKSISLLVEQLQENDRVALAVYAGSAGLVLPSTPVIDRRKILDALEQLQAGGSTNGAQGIQLAYQTALANFVKGGTNRVIVATDGDFNVGITDRTALIDLVTANAKQGVFLTTVGFGMGNIKDNTLEQLADKGNGQYAYIDDLPEARKLFVEELAGTLVTIAKDVKIQIEFNPAKVDSYRLIGYENRALRNEDFNDDKKDAGEIGAGHAVTALYEVAPAGRGDKTPQVDPLKYQQPPATKVAPSDELITLKLRYKQPDGDKSSLIEVPVKDADRSYAHASPDFKFAASVALFGMILRESEFKGTGTLDAVLELAHEGLGEKPDTYRNEFIRLVEAAKGMQRAQ